ncbi:MAG: bifunctional DNA-formamidopyrimidine glycosylase/DNA-(apurinic or apyrimidinic site) lyase [Chloroflexota bacterium]
MPELPEVETVARGLHNGTEGTPSLVGAKIDYAKVSWAKTVEEPSAKEFKKRIIGQTVEKVSRRGKYILIKLTDDTMLVHLRMSGDLLVGEGKTPLGRHSRLELYMEDGLQLSFNNPRKFGRVWLVPDPEMIVGGLGPEPFDPKLTAAKFHRMLGMKKRQIKPLLLDQKFIAGVGNIYADESLHRAKINPIRRAHTIEKDEAKLLLKSLRAVLKEGIRRNGASIDWAYQGGEFQNYFNVYQRTDEPCPVCGTPISRIVVGQRGTHYCKTCQPTPQD